MLLKNLNFEYKANTDKRQFEGYASTWDRDLGGDQIITGAFKKTIMERFPKNKIKILWQHNDPLGLPIHMEEDSKGLYVIGKISKTRLGDEALELMSDGVVDQMSIGYDVIEDDLSEDGQTRFLKQLVLYEFSPVTFPMNPNADIVSVKTHFNTLIKEFSNPVMATMLKEGRALNKANVQALKNAIETLQGILSQVEGSNEPKQLHSLEPFQEIIAQMKGYSAKSKRDPR
jgi:HK97 family phage prohead protease